jgi:hypothetical protein
VGRGHFKLTMDSGQWVPLRRTLLVLGLYIKEVRFGRCETSWTLPDLTHLAPSEIQRVALPY